MKLTRKPNWTSLEVTTLVEEISPYIAFLKSKFTNTVTNEKKSKMGRNFSKVCSLDILKVSSFYQLSRNTKIYIKVCAS